MTRTSGTLWTMIRVTCGTRLETPMGRLLVFAFNLARPSREAGCLFSATPLTPAGGVFLNHFRPGALVEEGLTFCFFVLVPCMRVAAWVHSVHWK